MDQLIALIERYKQLGIDSQIDYEKFYLYSIITHSTAIEGSTVTEIENQLLFDQGITAKGKKGIIHRPDADRRCQVHEGRVHPEGRFDVAGLYQHHSFAPVRRGPGHDGIVRAGIIGHEGHPLPDGRRADVVGQLRL